MNGVKKSTILFLLLLADAIGFLLLIPAIASDVPVEFWTFLFGFIALLLVYSGIAFGFFDVKFRRRKTKERGPEWSGWEILPVEHAPQPHEDSE